VSSHQRPALPRPVHLIIKMIKWIRTSRLSIKNSVSEGFRIYQAHRGGVDVLAPFDRAGLAENHLPEGRCKATWKREFNLPWREAGPPHHHDDTVDSDQ